MKNTGNIMLQMSLNMLYKFHETCASSSLTFVFAFSLFTSMVIPCKTLLFSSFPMLGIRVPCLIDRQLAC